MVFRRGTTTALRRVMITNQRALYFLPVGAREIYRKLLDSGLNTTISCYYPLKPTNSKYRILP